MSSENWKIRLINPDTGDHLMATVVAEFEFEERRYYAVVPDDELVEIIRVEGEGDDASLDEIDLEDFPAIASAVNAALRPFGAAVEARADELILTGDPGEGLYEQGEMMGVETEEGVERDLLILARVKAAGAEHLVVIDAGVNFYPACPHGDGDARPLTEEELEVARDAFEEVAAALDEAAGLGDDDDDV